jgi:2-polyprenyl-3-methyl-5-hydroxy-6-metoxy-1,4-benzoquinol methylase
MSAARVKYEKMPGSLMNSRLLEECAAFYSEHYGRWGPAASSPNTPGDPVRLSAKKLRAWIASADSEVAFARTDDGTLIGYVICVHISVPRYGLVSWVTQLVVHMDYRHQDVGKTLLFRSWGFTDRFAWGVISANPYAIRALEKATRRRCVPARIKANKRKLLTVGAMCVPYVGSEMQTLVTSEASRINTYFFVDRGNLGEMIKSVTRGVNWLLGELPDGWEWFAFTFRDQEQLQLTSDEIATMLAASDQFVREAYSRMQVQEPQPWARHTESELNLIVQYCQLNAGSRVLDLGCGTGRHAIGLAARGLDVTGVDYVPEFIEAAQHNAQARAVIATFVNADCRDYRAGSEYDAVVCLYDVIGTYADMAENRRLIDSIYAHLRPGGLALVSVMNYELTERNAKRFFSMKDNPNELLSLPASRTMEKTGNVFDSEYYMVDRDTHAIYRKEQFQSGSRLPVELVVRDRRFTMTEIREACASAGLHVVWSRFVKAGRWEPGFPRESNDSKEILVLCQRPASPDLAREPTHSHRGG